MTAREDFTDDEWFELRSAPWRAAMGVIEVDPSGTLTTGRELEAVNAVLAAAQFDEGLIGLVTRDLLDLDPPEDGDDDRPPAGAVAADEERKTDESFSDRVLDAMADLRAILDDKLTPAEAEAFRRWVLSAAEAAAEAGREGLAGLTGPTVSDEESDYLTRLRAALG